MSCRQRKGTAIALHLGHRESLDFDFFRSEPLDKDQVRGVFGFVRGATVLQDAPETLMILAEMPASSVKVSFFGGIGFGRINDPLLTRDGTLLVASLDDLMATKLKAILDHAEAKDYRDIAAMISAAVSLPAGRTGAGSARAWLFRRRRPEGAPHHRSRRFVQRARSSRPVTGGAAEAGVLNRTLSCLG
jgi:hypothetical protein